MEGKNKMFNGEGDVKEFIMKVELNSALKGLHRREMGSKSGSKIGRSII